MLTHLAIRDFAVVTVAELDFSAGLTVISGETGAGKSLLVDALGFLSGARADSGMVRHGAERAELSAVFDLADAPAATAWLSAQDMDDDGQCQLRRTLRADGGSRAWINGRPATLAQLAELAALLVEIHGQHEHQALLSRGSQLDLLDAFAGNGVTRAAVAAAARRWSGLLREQELLSAQGDAAGRSAWLRHQLAELGNEALSPADIERTLAEHRRHAHAADLVAACEGAVARLGGEGDDGTSAPLARTLQQVRDALARVVAHESRLGEVDGMLDAAAIQLDEALLALERIRSDLDLDRQRDARELATRRDLAQWARRLPWIGGDQELHAFGPLWIGALFADPFECDFEAPAAHAEFAEQGRSRIAERLACLPARAAQGRGRGAPRRLGFGDVRAQLAQAFSGAFE